MPSRRVKRYGVPGDCDIPNCDENLVRYHYTVGDDVEYRACGRHRSRARKIARQLNKLFIERKLA